MLHKVVCVGLTYCSLYGSCIISLLLCICFPWWPDGLNVRQGLFPRVLDKSVFWFHINDNNTVSSWWRGILTIAPPVRVGVWLRISFGVGAIFLRGHCPRTNKGSYGVLQIKTCVFINLRTIVCRWSKNINDDGRSVTTLTHFWPMFHCL